MPDTVRRNGSQETVDTVCRICPISPAHFPAGTGWASTDGCISAVLVSICAADGGGEPARPCGDRDFFGHKVPFLVVVTGWCRACRLEPVIRLVCDSV